MWTYLSSLTGIIVFLGLVLAHGSAHDGSCLCTSQFGRKDVCELVREVTQKTHEIVTALGMVEYDGIVIRGSELNNIIDQRIRDYLKKNQWSSTNNEQNFHSTDSKGRFDSQIDDDETKPREVECSFSEQEGLAASLHEIAERLENLASEFLVKTSILEGRLEETELRMKELEEKVLETQTQVIKEIQAASKDFRHEMLQKLNETKKSYTELENLLYKTRESVKGSLEVMCSIVSYSEKDAIATHINGFPSVENFKNTCDKNFSQGRSTAQHVTYEELEKLNTTCGSLDNCKIQRNSDTLNVYNCHCGHFCTQLDTCCIDSPHVGEPSEGPIPTCQEVFGSDGKTYFVVDRCPEDEVTSNEWKRFCAGEGGKGDILTLVPVTSLSTNITYSNYYCFLCHETGEAYLFWGVELISNFELAIDTDDNPILEYDAIQDAWVSPEAETFIPAAIKVHIDIPVRISDLVKECRWGVLSSCHNSWTDDSTSRKCREYTSIVHFSGPASTKRYYKNPHCALCNFESLKDMLCREYFAGRAFGEGGKNKQQFDYTQMFKVSRRRKCPINFIWDPFNKECKSLKCAEGYQLKDRECVRF